MLITIISCIISAVIAALLTLCIILAWLLKVSTKVPISRPLPGEHAGFSQLAVPSMSDTVRAAIGPSKSAVADEEDRLKAQNEQMEVGLFRVRMIEDFGWDPVTQELVGVDRTDEMVTI